MKRTPPVRPRGRPRSFDEDQVLAAVLDTFWTRGYAGTSLDDLAAAAGVTRPSLYTALGDKRSMYLRALAHFEEGLKAQLARSLDPARPLAEGIRELYLSGIDLYLSGHPPRGCLIVCTAATEAPTDPETRKALAGVLARVDRAFEARLAAELGGGAGQAARAAALAQVASAVVHSLAIRARAGLGRAQLVQLAETGAALVVCGTLRAASS